LQAFARSWLNVERRYNLPLLKNWQTMVNISVLLEKNMLPHRDANSHEQRNPGTRLDLGSVKDVRVNRSAIERRAATLGTRRTVKKEVQAAWLLHAVKTIDLTTLSGDDTEGTVKRLCAKARQPISAKLLADLGVSEAFAQQPLTTGAVCVYHRFVATAVEALQGSGIPVAAVSTGFPAGLNPLSQKIEEIEASVKAGAAEIDIVISREHVLTGNWCGLYDEVKAFREACGAAHMKAIIATGELGTLKNIMRASIISMQAGSDFIKTSTGKEPTNATLAGSLVMLRAIRAYHEQTGVKIGFKPAGGIRSAKQSLDWLMLMKEELGDEWMQPDLFRIGASALVNDIERQLEHFAYGRYASMQYQALG
jgi:deoxyribose-phosphate aldolase